MDCDFDEVALRADEVADVAPMARRCAAFYRTLITEGIPEVPAIHLTEVFMEHEWPCEEEADDED